MARTVLFPYCPCCGSSSSTSRSTSGSQSRSGSGSGSDANCSGWYCCRATGSVFYAVNCADLETKINECAPSISRSGICFNRSVPSVLYVEFGGAMASLGTIPYLWNGGPAGVGFYQWGNGEGIDNGEGSGSIEFTICGQFFFTNINICGGLAEGELVIAFGAPGGGTTCALRLTESFMVTSWEPFVTTTITGLMGYEGQESCPCLDQEFTIKITGGPNDVSPNTIVSGPYATQAEAMAACSSSSSSGGSKNPCCPNGRDLPFSFDGSYNQTAGGGSPASGSLTFTYNDGSGPGGDLGAGWYSNSFQACLVDSKPPGRDCCDTYRLYYRCYTNPDTGVSSWRMTLHAEPGPYAMELGYSFNGKWSVTGPIGECTGAEFEFFIPYGINCEDISSTDGGDEAPPLMAIRTEQPATAAAKTPDRFALPLCRYEGAALEYASCGCEGKHVRNCDNPYQGGTDPEGRTVPDIDRCQREYNPDSTLTSCERCPYRKAVDDV